MSPFSTSALKAGTLIQRAAWWCPPIDEFDLREEIHDKLSVSMICSLDESCKTCRKCNSMAMASWMWQSLHSPKKIWLLEALLASYYREVGAAVVPAPLPGVKWEEAGLWLTNWTQTTCSTWYHLRHPPLRNQACYIMRAELLHFLLGDNPRSTSKISILAEILRWPSFLSHHQRTCFQSPHQRAPISDREYWTSLVLSWWCIIWNNALFV